MASEKKELNSFTTWKQTSPQTQAMSTTPLSNVKLSVLPAFSIPDDEDATISNTLKHDWIILGLACTSEDDVSIKGNKIAECIDETETHGILSSILDEHKKSIVKFASLTPSVRVVLSDKKIKQYSFLNMGDMSKFPPNYEYKVGCSLAKTLTESNKKEEQTISVGILLPHLPGTFSYRDLSTGFYSTLYLDNRFRSTPKPLPAASILNVSFYDTSSSSELSATVMEEVSLGKHIASGMNYTKDIVNAPHNVLNSISMAETIKQLAKEYDNLTCTILNAKECEKRGMGSFLAVGRGSETEAQFIDLTYKPKGEIKHKVGFVGKGVMFDTGGNNIKTQMMELMKFDCGGAAAVFGAAKAIAALAPDNVEVHFIVAACENMVNDKAYVPSDILIASNGKTIEVLNTDAEGRLTMADALVYADKEVNCDKIIELSTLTGSCIVALGKKIAGLWTDNDELADKLLSISTKTSEKLHRMPLEFEYNEMLESKIADMKNIGDRWGGSITAALFLHKFVDYENTPYAHLDIAGPVWDDKAGSGTGYGVRLLTEFVTDLASTSTSS